ncbi:BRO family protein [Pulveribacter sp.]|uniref:BRO-N domain-containing protein n=1 Tax=Pulveribacter sp. TaxID=2678893 RepID=UPI0028AF1363|nr:BRO family protein [Pulveribacter sp.]
MSNIVLHDFEGLSVRTVQIEDKTYFVGKDAAEALGYADATTAIRSHCRGVQVLHPIPDSLGRLQDTRVIDEPDLMRLVVNSTLAGAERFERWVFEDVLPSIRKTGSYSMPQAEQPKPDDTSGLPEYRRARALDMAAKTAERILVQFPSLSEDSRRVVFANIINPVVGIEVLALPRVEKKHHTAGEVGELLGISSNMVGRIANTHSLKTDEHGMYLLDKSRHSSKQVQTFVYNDAGVEAIRAHLEVDKAEKGTGSRAAKRSHATACI